jgi:GH15 family glucan-1,4-alpha-glucosidase
MPSRIEDYAAIGNGETVALVERGGSIDWLCLPRIDSPACFAALLGDPSHGRWLLSPVDVGATSSRRYRDGTMVLETTFETATGSVRVSDVLSRRNGVSDLVRRVEGLSGVVAMRVELAVRFEYGSIAPWLSRRQDGRFQLVAGPDQLLFATPVTMQAENGNLAGGFEVEGGTTVDLTLSWAPSFHAPPSAVQVDDVLRKEVENAAGWCDRIDPAGDWSEAVERSLLTLKSLANWETGGIAAAPTTSLPELIGGSRNWDYRYCWLRDATFTLYALIGSGFLEEAEAWRHWLLRAVAGSPEQVRTMYGVGGERLPPERTAPWLPGFENSSPVRLGNAAAGQLQLDVYGEVLDALYLARCAGMEADTASWSLQCALIAHLETIWDQPDDGIWEVRGGRRHFTHSKVMAWVAFDRAIRSAQEFGLDAPDIGRWRRVRDTIHREVLNRGFDRDKNSFVQSYGSSDLDASLLLLPIVGFLAPDDPRVVGTVTAVERELLDHGLVLRYRTDKGTDGLPSGEGAFLACSFWLADNYVLMGRKDDARALFERLIALRNDVGLLAEEYDPVGNRQLGNFPQAFSHLALVNTAYNLSGAGPAHHRSGVTRSPEGKQRVPFGDRIGR